jgi:hypothetical protein
MLHPGVSMTPTLDRWKKNIPWPPVLPCVVEEVIGGHVVNASLAHAIANITNIVDPYTLLNGT